ncbi:MAG: UDP-N-acetylglucosamine 2-epimerase (non-hydrolyzing) [Bacteroidales bacterium]|jgi:UDP-N-acetylglucosamine 2-epimerase (non-hydrolysing)|nr:UDP-N-acetylglucosamine 2-epimerase (non-hydrolyzing) [Bacteroidales bacterium]
MKKILICFGTRPEAIKMCVLIHDIKSAGIDIKVCVTAQHREMLDQALNFFEIEPDYDLDLMKSNQSLNELSSKILSELDKILSIEQFDLIFVHGDTTTSTICALAGFYRGIKVCHVEAGLRTYNKQSPFPEELNRQLTGRIADYHFSPTVNAKENLIRENVISENVIVTGNTVIDSLFWTKQKLDNGYQNKNILLLETIINPTKKTILVTCHRRENFGEAFVNICKSLIEIATQTDVEIIFPVHLNPKIQEPANYYLSGHENIHLILPLDYPAFVWLIDKSYLIISDSGGIQEEAPSLGKPVLVLRDTTERPEAVSAGTVRLVGTDMEVIQNNVNELLNSSDTYNKMTKSYNPYGDGRANMRIINFIKQLT